MADLKEQRICMKFCFALGRTASETHEMLKTAFGDNAMGRTQTFEWFSRFKRGSNIKSMLVIFFDCEGIVHQKFVPPSQTVNQHYYLEVLKRLRSKSAKNARNDGETKTGCFTMTVRRPTLLCLCSDFWPLKTWLWSPTLLTPLIWPLAIFSCFRE
jgi:hypothetical protein